MGLQAHEEAQITNGLQPRFFFQIPSQAPSIGLKCLKSKANKKRNNSHQTTYKTSYYFHTYHNI
jgi:hypothetical protein